MLLEALAEPVLELLERDGVADEDEVPAELGLDRRRHLVQRERGGGLLERRVELLPVDAAELAPVARRSRVGRLLAGELLEARPRRDLGGEAGGQLLVGHENVRHEAARRALLPELGDRGLVRSADVDVGRRRAGGAEERGLPGEPADGLVAEPLRERSQRLRPEEVRRLRLARPPVIRRHPDAASVHLAVDDFLCDHVCEPDRAAARLDGALGGRDLVLEAGVARDRRQLAVDRVA